jgi:hypothetical protein
VRLIDRWDGFGFAALLIVVAGVWDLAGRGWAAIALGGPLLLVYFLREIRITLREKGD